MSVTTQWGVQLHLDALTFPADWFWSPVFFFLTKFIVTSAEVLFIINCFSLSCEMTWCGQQWESLNTSWICGQNAGRLRGPSGSSSSFREGCAWSGVYLGASYGCGKAERFWSLLPSPLMDQEWEGCHGATGSQIASTPGSGGLGARYLGKF